MTPADLAMKNAIAFECKKDGLRQTQAGTWKVTFTVLDMDERLTKAFPGTRYQAVLVEIDDSEMPVSKPAAKETSPNPPKSDPATPSLSLDKPAEKAKREKMDWRDVQPAAQSAIRCQDPIFVAFLKEQHEPYWETYGDAARVVRSICEVKSRIELNTVHPCRVLWKQLDDQFQAWQRIGA